MRFGEPGVLWALLMVPALGWIMFQTQRRVQARLSRLVAPRLLENLLDPIVFSRRLWRCALLLAALSCFVIALARPQWGTFEHPVVQKGREILLAIDTSKSMLANDVVPNRLTRAKLAAEDLVRAMPGDRFGVIAFAGDAQIQAPMTVDYPSILETIAALNTNTVERGGTDFAAVIRAAEQAFGKDEGVTKALVIMTDGEELDEDGLAAAQRISGSGIRVFTLGIGSETGANIPLESGNLLRDRGGRNVTTRLDENFLRQLAQAGGGFYSHLDAGAVERVVNDGLRLVTEKSFGDRSIRNPIERYRWPLLIGLVLLFFFFISGDRKRPASGVWSWRQASGVLLILLLGSSIVASASSALDLYQRGDFEGALNNLHEQLNRHPDSARLNYNAGDAAYRLGRYDEAFESYSRVLRSSDPDLRQKAYYNAGNSLFKEGDGQSEIEPRLTNYYDARYLYHQSLNLDPQDEATKKNLALLERRIKETEQQREQIRQQQAARQRSRSSKKKGGKRRQPNEKGQHGNDSNQDPSPNGQEQNPGRGQGQEDAETGSDDDPDQSQPEPAPGKEKKGDLRENGPSEQQQQQEKIPGIDPPLEGGHMTPDEAMGLLQSLQNEEDRVDLTHRKRDRGVARDW
jgi:Ca-activated chloride channel homolog